jgi:aryl-alcohol dehydrogenase-like predicted oxidoreductase
VEQRRLGRTGYKVTVLTIGGAGIGFVPDSQEGVKAFEFALEKGLNMLDIAPSYGDAEARAGPLVRKYRSKLVIAEKTLERTREGTWAELKRPPREAGGSCNPPLARGSLNPGYSTALVPPQRSCRAYSSSAPLASSGARFSRGVTVMTP